MLRRLFPVEPEFGPITCISCSLRRLGDDTWQAAKLHRDCGFLRFRPAVSPRRVGAKEKLESAIELAADAITEGRDAVQGLRASTVQTNDLARAISTLGEELAADPGSRSSSVFRVAVEGESRDLRPLVRDEVYRIGAEALRNAFHHAQAPRIEVEIRYDTRQFTLHVRDDGRGIDPQVLSGDGREGHYGLHGMKERAKLVGGELVLWSEGNAGTEVELRIPAAMAYEGTRRPWWPGQFSRKQGDGAKTDS